MEITKTIYVENADKFIYKVADLEMRADGWLNIWLDLVCGVDYINADESDVLGYVGKENFVEEIEHELISCDMMKESITQALEFHGYSVIEELPTIHKKRGDAIMLREQIEEYLEMIESDYKSFQAGTAAEKKLVAAILKNYITDLKEILEETAGE